MAIEIRLGQFSESNESQYWSGVTTPNGDVIDLVKAGKEAKVELPRKTKHRFSEWEWKRKAELAVERALETGKGVEKAENLIQRPPLTEPQKAIAVGLNYMDHAEEGENPVPDKPVIFSKFPSAIIGPDSTISWNSDFATSVDFEAELVAVIGRTAREVSCENGRNYVTGYTIGNDVSARDIQHGNEQWVRGKSLDTFAPIGPEIVTSDVVTDPHDLDIWTEINGERYQDSTTSKLIFGVDELVSFCSQAFTLHPGDLIFTGTPPGVGVYREPPVLLEQGDSVTVGIEELGELINTCGTGGDVSKSERTNQKSHSGEKYVLYEFALPDCTNIK